MPKETQDAQSHTQADLIAIFVVLILDDENKVKTRQDSGLEFDVLETKAKKKSRMEPPPY